MSWWMVPAVITFLAVVVIIEVLRTSLNLNKEMRESREMNLNDPIAPEEVAVVVIGKCGKTFRRDWRADANRSDIIGWTLLYEEDFPFDEIARIEIIERK